MKLQIHSMCWYVIKTASESFCLCYRNSSLSLSDDVINLQNWLMVSVCLSIPTDDVIPN